VLHAGDRKRRSGDGFGVPGGNIVTKPFARIGQVRSVGIAGLRHGNVLHAGWHDAGTVPLPAGVACYTTRRGHHAGARQGPADGGAGGAGAATGALAGSIASRRIEGLAAARGPMPELGYQDMVSSSGSVDRMGFPATTASAFRRWGCPVFPFEALAMACTSTVAGQLMRRVSLGPSARPRWVQRWSAVTASLKVFSTMVTPNDAEVLCA
jgi:hypothetical protein